MQTSLILTSLILLAMASSVFGVELQKICSKDTFHYENHQVNSVHLIKTEVNLQSIVWFAIENEDISKFFTNKTLGDEMQKLKKEHDRILTGLYSESFLNQNLSSQSFVEMRNDTEKIHLKMLQLLNENTVTDDLLSIEAIRYIVLRTIHLIDFLSSFYDSKLPERKNEIDDQLLEGKFFDLRPILENLTISDNQKFAFDQDSISEINKKQIIGTPKFYLQKYSELTYDSRTKGRLQFTIFLPFDDLNYDQNLTNSTCLKAADLPKFYQDKH